MIRILNDTKSLFTRESSLVDIHLTKDERLNICGDIHGQFYDLANIFDMLGFPNEENQYLFNGDFVDRGVWSVEVIMVLFGFKLLWPGEKQKTLLQQGFILNKMPLLHLWQNFEKIPV